MSSEIVLSQYLQATISGDTNVGLKRDHNEDCLHLPQSEGLVVVADGMGGHEGGEIASRIAVDTVVEYFRETNDEVDETWPFMLHHGRHSRHITRIENAVKLANHNIFTYARQQSFKKSMGTTIVTGFLDDPDFVLAHVGDSRIYKINGQGMSQITSDHSLLNDYIRLRRIRPEDAHAFPHKNVIVRALGIKSTVHVDIHRIQPVVGDLFLFCSDGLSGMLSDRKMLEIIREKKSIDDMANELINAANDAGGTDNITVALVRFDRPDTNRKQTVPM